MAAGGQTRKKKLTLRKTHIFVEKCDEDVNQDEKHFPYLLEAIVKGSGRVREESRRILIKMDQFRSQTIKIGVCTFEMSRKTTDSVNLASETVISTYSHSELTLPDPNERKKVKMY